MSAWTRERVAGLSTEEYDQHQAEILRWLRDGAEEGAEAPPEQLPDDHVWTRAGIGAMTVDEFVAHEDRIMAAMQAGEVEG